MEAPNNQLTHSESPSAMNNQPMETEKSFSLTRRQIILSGLVGGLVLLLIFGLGVRAGEKRALRKQSLPQVQSTPTTIQLSPTTAPTPTPTSTPTSYSVPSTESTRDEKGIPSSSPACERDVDCLSCFAVPGTPIVNCDAGRCVDGVCVWEKPAPGLKRHE